MLNASLFYPINGFDKYKMNPFFKNLTIEQQKQLMLLIKERNCDFPKESLCLFSMAQFVRRRLLAPIRPSISYNLNQIKESYEEFLKQCSRKFGLSLSPQFIIRGRSNPINPQDVIRFQSSVLLQDQIIAISNYGPAFFLGNTSAIAEMCYRLSKIINYDRNGEAKLISLIEYGISLGYPDCLGVMAYFSFIEYGGAVRKDALKLAGQSAEAGSIYGWFSLAGLLKDNSEHASYHDKYDDGIDVDEYDLGVRQFVCSRIPLDEQIRQALEEHGCELCLPQFYDGKEKCRGCGFEFDVFNYYPDDDDTSIPKSEQMRIAVEIYYKILSENPPSHPICVDSRKNLVKIYKETEWIFGGSQQTTDEEIHRLEAI
jgi:hypothetical protein